MAIVRNLLVRAGADFGQAQKSMNKFQRDLDKFGNRTDKSMKRTNDALNSVKNSGVSNFSVKLSKNIERVTDRMDGAAESVGIFTGMLIRLGARLGPVGVGLTIAGVAVAAFTVGVGLAAQTAVKFQADIGRLNMQLGKNTQGFMDWARAQKLSRSTAAEMGATYSTLLSSFLQGNDKVFESTKELVQATRVVASATGRSIDDTTERIRSGLLGNTEAIEDLGIFVNISMIESTKAFQKFANGKHWDQLDFRVQQQIRLQAILEQATARYGNSLQANVMTKQDQLIEQWKDIKLNLSNAFLPLWDWILPALTKLAEYVANVTDSIARFIYAVKGWDYDKATKGTNEQTKATDGLADSYKKAGEAAKDALAPFDEINQIGDKGGAGGSGNGGTGGNSGGSPTPTSPSQPDYKLPDFSDLPALPELRLKFGEPTPPDAGAGGVVSTVLEKFDTLDSNIREKMQGMWEGIKVQSSAGIQALAADWANLWNTMQGQTVSGRQSQESSWQGLSSTLTGAIVPGTTLTIPLMWANMWGQINAVDTTARVTLTTDWTTFTGSLKTLTNDTGNTIQSKWHETLDYMQSQLNAYQPYISYGFDLIGESILGLTPVLELTKVAWHEALDYMQSQLNAYEPYISLGMGLISIAALGTIPVMADTESAWRNSLSNMASVMETQSASILSRIEAIKTAYAQMAAMLGSPVQVPNISLPKIELPDMSGITSQLKEAFTPSAGLTDFSWIFSKETMQGVADTLQQEAAKQENQAGLSILGTLLPMGRLGKIGTKVVGEAAEGLTKKSLKEVLEEITKSRSIPRGGRIRDAVENVPAMATGALVHSPTLAMVGDNPGAMNDPEVISPLSKLEGMINVRDESMADSIASAVGTAVMAAMQAGGQARSGQQGDIVFAIDGVAFARITNAYNANESKRIGGSMMTIT